VAYAVSKFVLPPVFKMVARTAGTGAGRRAGVVFFDGGLRGLAGFVHRDGRAHRRRDDLQPFPTRWTWWPKVTSLRDFFVTLFFVSLGMAIPLPTWGYLLWTIFFCLFLIGSRLATIFPVLYALRQGYRVSLLPASISAS